MKTINKITYKELKEITKRAYIAIQEYKRAKLNEMLLELYSNKDNEEEKE